MKIDRSVMASNRSETSSTASKEDLLNEILTCGICLSRMTSPCCLPCAHSFCRSCLLDYARNHNIHTSAPINSILCPYCKFQVNFHSLEHFESMLVINPILKQLCEMLESSKISSDSTSSSSSSTSGMSRARCHACCLLKMLKVCKHCFFMLCETCRRTHLLDVHRDSTAQLELLDSRLRLIHEKRAELDHLTHRYEEMREEIRTYAERCLHEIEQQREDALRILDEQQNNNEQLFWTNNGFDTGEKLDFFISLAESSRQKLIAKNITDRELMDIADNLQTMPNIDEKTIRSIRYRVLDLELDQEFPMKRYIRLYDHEENQPTMDSPPCEELSMDSAQSDCIHS